MAEKLIADDVKDLEEMRELLEKSNIPYMEALDIISKRIDLFIQNHPEHGKVVPAMDYAAVVMGITRAAVQVAIQAGFDSASYMSLCDCTWKDLAETLQADGMLFEKINEDGVKTSPSGPVKH